MSLHSEIIYSGIMVTENPFVFGKAVRGKFFIYRADDESVLISTSRMTSIR